MGTLGQANTALGLLALGAAVAEADLVREHTAALPAYK